jgi:hypothetical protein
MRAVKSADSARTARSGEPSGPPSHEEIAARAYQLYLERGASDGNDLQDWFTAEDRVLEERQSELATV